MGEAQRRANRPKVMIGFVHPADYPAAFGNWMMNFVLYDSKHEQAFAGRGGGAFCQMESSPRIASARNRIVRTFLASDYDLLWMVDADMVGNPETLYRLLECVDDAHPIVAGMYFHGGRGPIHEPTLFEFGTLPDGRKTSSQIRNFETNTLMEIDGTGAGCMLIQRQVLETVYDAFKASAFPWFAEAELDGEEIGEDITFFMRCKALGIPLHVHTGIVPLHQKRTYLGMRSWEAQQAMIAEHGEEAIWKAFAEETGGTLA